jgi:hypothetical protein
VLARIFAWTGFAAALLFVGSLTVFGHPGSLAMSPAALWQGCSWSESCPADDLSTAAIPRGQVASVPGQAATR